MLYDRPYMRTGEWRGQWPLTYVLMAVNVGVFFLHGIFGFYSRIPVDLYFGLSLEGLSRGYLWQLLSFQFLHAGLWHLLFNLIGLYFLGRAV